MIKDSFSIMVADNDPEIVKNLSMVLNDKGHFVECVNNGKEAIRKIKNDSYDLVFTDLSLRGIDGVTLIQWIKQYRPATGVVVMTDNSLKNAANDANSLGVISHLTKPFTHEMLRDVTDRTAEWVKEYALKNEQEEEYPAEKLAALDEVIDQCRQTSGQAVRVLLHAQHIFGCVSPSIQKRIAQSLHMSPAEIRSIVSFHSCFRTKPEVTYIPSYLSGVEKAWNSVKWMTGKRAVNAVNEFLKMRQETTQV